MCRRQTSPQGHRRGGLDVVEFDGQAPNGELVMSQTQIFPVNDGGGGDRKEDNDVVTAVKDEAIDASKPVDSQPNRARVLPSKSISKTAVPPRHAPVKLEESVEPVPQNPSLSVVPLPASPKKSDEDTGKPVSEAPLEGRSKDDDAETAASKTKIHLDPPEATRTVSPPLPLYNFKSPVHKPLKSTTGQASPHRMGANFGSEGRERPPGASKRRSLKRCQRPG